MLYRLFTEDIDRDTTLDLVGKFVPGFTAYPTIGYWQGARENSLCIEIESDELTPREVDAIAAAICVQNKQQCVLVQTIQNSSRFVESTAIEHVPDLALNEHAEERALDPVADAAEIERGAELIRWLNEARTERGQALAETALTLCIVVLALLAVFAASQGAGGLDALASLIP